MKQYIILVRENLEKYSLGKNIIHACHNSQIASRDCYISDKARDIDWSIIGQITKILVTVDTIAQLNALLFKATELSIQYVSENRNSSIPNIAIRDAGKKETEENTIICGAIGPVTKAEAKLIGLDKLKLFKGELK